MVPNDNTAEEIETSQQWAEPEPANDNHEGLSIDLETDPDDAANDNREEEEPLPRDPRGYDYVESEVGRLNQLLSLAGYDPYLIPPDRRRIAFEVALCFEKRMFGYDDIVETLSFTHGQVRRAIDALRIAARPGTTVG
jgi:hypothetical protein